MTTPDLITAVDRTIDIYEKAIGQAANRTRQMIERHGAVEALSRLVESPDLQQGFRVLRDRGELDNTFEAIIVRFPKLFPDKVVEAAQWRLDNADQLR